MVRLLFSGFENYYEGTNQFEEHSTVSIKSLKSAGVKLFVKHFKQVVKIDLQRVRANAQRGFILIQIQLSFCLMVFQFVLWWLSWEAFIAIQYSRIV